MAGKNDKPRIEVRPVTQGTWPYVWRTIVVGIIGFILLYLGIGLVLLIASIF